MAGYELYHHGIKGMKWGVRRTAAQLGHVVKGAYKKRQEKRKAEKEEEERKKKAAEELKQRRKPARLLTEEELKARISRLELEKKYKDLAKDVDGVNQGKKIANEILEDSVKNIGKQTLTYLMGTGVNAIAKDVFKIVDPVVNPKKGQKDK